MNNLEITKKLLRHFSLLNVKVRSDGWKLFHLTVEIEAGSKKTGFQLSLQSFKVPCHSGVTLRTHTNTHTHTHTHCVYTRSTMVKTTSFVGQNK